MSSYNPISQNPYIVGNPIREASMFFGRHADFQFITEKFLSEPNGSIITLAGERRSGKTSILFQIMNGRLGSGFLPFFIDMQAMPGVDTTRKFLEKILQTIHLVTGFEELSMSPDGDEFSEFESMIKRLRQLVPGSRILLLVDEYEIIEKKIEEGKIQKEIISFCASLIEQHDLFFLFTGSNKLENRNPFYWKALFTKSHNRKIPYLSKQECFALVTQPVSDMVLYTAKHLERIFRLTAGHPFYTQIICQNMVHLMMTSQRNEVTDNDIDHVVTDILSNPIPQMIYYWQEFSRPRRIVLALIAEIINGGNQFTGIDSVQAWLERYYPEPLILDEPVIESLADLEKREILMFDGSAFVFRMDFFRKWIKQEQDIWKIISEENSKNMNN